MTAPRPRLRRPARPRLEQLERRDTPADFSVSTFAELSGAVTTANANGQDDRVFFLADITGGQLRVGEAGKTLAFAGAAAPAVRFKLDGGNATRLFDVAAGTVTFADLALTRGRVVGSDATGPARGGALAVESGAVAQLARVTVSGNTAVGSTQFPDAAGGAIYVAAGGTLTATACGFDANQAVGFSFATAPLPPTPPPPAGSGLRGEQGFSGQSGGTATGGAVAGAGTITVVGSVFQANTTTGGGGGPGGFGGDGTGASSMPGGAGGDGGFGGAGGSAAGGAIHTTGLLKVYSSLIGAGNTATGGSGGSGGGGGTGGGGFFARSGDGGTGGSGGRSGDAHGGAVMVGAAGPDAVIGNSTVTGNAAAVGASVAGGAGGAAGSGTSSGTAGEAGAAGMGGVLGAGGVEVDAGGQLIFASTTVAGNTGGGGVVVGAGSTVGAFNSLFAGNPSGDVRGPGGVTASGSLFGATAVTITPAAGGVANVFGFDPGLAALAANGTADIGGGFVRRTLAIASTSKAADIGDPSKLTAALLGPDFTHDGRGGTFDRLSETKTDAGSFEAVAGTGQQPQGDLQVTRTQTGNTGTFTVTNAGPDRLPAARITDAATGAMVVVTRQSRTTGGGAVPAAAFTPGTSPLAETIDLPAGASVTYTFAATVPAGGTGSYTAAAAAGPAATDLNLANNSAAFTLTGPPLPPPPPPPLTVTLDQAAGQADPTPTPAVMFDVVFSAPVLSSSDTGTTAFDAGDIDLTGTDAGGNAVVTIRPAAGEGAPAARYTVTVSGLTGGGRVVASVRGGTVVAAADPGVSNRPSTSGDNTVTFTPPAPVLPKLVLAAGPAVAGQPLAVTVTAVNPDGSPAGGFAGTVTVTLNSVVGSPVESQPVTFTADGAAQVATFTPAVPGTATVAAAAVPGVTAAVPLVLSVAPAAAPGGNLPLGDPVFQHDGPPVQVFSGGRFYNTSQQAADEPVTLANSGSGSTVSILAISPDHLGSYPIAPDTTPDGTTAGLASANSLTTANLCS